MSAFDDLKHRVELIEVALASPALAKKDRGPVWGFAGVVAGGLIAGGFLTYSNHQNASLTDCTAVVQRADAIVIANPEAPFDYTVGDAKACNIKEHVEYVRTHPGAASSGVPTPKAT